MPVRVLAACLCVLFVPGVHPAFAQNPFELVTGPLSNEDTRLTVGVESVASSASKGRQHLLMDFMVTAPLGKEVTRTQKPKATAWLNARFNGAPTNAVSGVKQFVGGFEKELVSGDTSTLLNTLAFRAGLEFQIPRAPGFSFGNDFQFQPTIIAAMGIQTVPPLETPAVFDLSSAARERWGAQDAKYKHIALTSPDRREFYRTFEIGLRLKTHHFNECEEPAHPKCSRDRRRNFPGIVDLTLGQDASVTGGVRRGIVARVDAFYPLPTDNIANAVYLFGAIRVQRVEGLVVEDDPIILRAPSVAVTLPSDEVFQHTLTADERTRDEWKLGMGVDLVRLFTAAMTQRAADAASAAAEDGSIVDIAKNDDVAVARRLLAPGETRTFNHGVDVIIPIDTANLEATAIPPPGSGTLPFKAGEPLVQLAVKRKLTNTTKVKFEAIVVKVKAGEGKATMPAVKSYEDVRSRPDESKYRVSVVTCPAMCDFKQGADVDNSVAIVPITETKITMNGKEQTKKPYEAVVLNRKTEFSVGSASTFVLVRIP
jgi:hypothetical protein